ncbi:hypothetical protein IWX91DRAFT_28937 [Phyllosticta citricarpa]
MYSSIVMLYRICRSTRSAALAIMSLLQCSLSKPEIALRKGGATIGTDSCTPRCCKPDTKRNPSVVRATAVPRSWPSINTVVQQLCSHRMPRGSTRLHVAWFSIVWERSFSWAGCKTCSGPCRRLGRGPYSLDPLK